MSDESLKKNRTLFAKIVHYVTLISLFLLIIPAGLNPVYFNIGFMLFGINIAVNAIDRRHTVTRGNLLFTLMLCVALVLFGVFRLIFWRQK